MLIRELTRESTALVVDTPDLMNAAMKRQTRDIIFGAYTIPRFNGVDALGLLRKRVPDMPFIFVSGAIGEGIAVATRKSLTPNNA